MQRHTLAIATALSLLTVFAVPAAPAQSSTLVVDDDASDCPDAGYSQIQDAIGDAGDDDTVEVCAGTYEEALIIDDLDGFTLDGAGSEEVTIDAPDDGQYDIDVGGTPGALDADVALSGFTLDGGDSFGLKAAFIDGFTVEDVDLQGSDGTGLDLHTVNDVEITDVEATDNDANGIAVRNADGVTLTNVATSSNAWGGLAFYAPDTETVENVLVSDSQFEDEGAGVYLQYEGYSDIRIEGSTFTGNAIGLTVNDDFGGPPEADAVTVRHSTFEDNTEAVVNDDADALDARENWWGSPLGPTHEDNPLAATGETGDRVSDHVDYAPWCVQPSCPILSTLP